MLNLDSFGPVAETARGAYLAVGNFDGVHRGHARLIGLLKERASAHGVPAIALTFDPSPAAFLRPGSAPSPLTWPDRKVELLREAGADDVGVFRTGTWLLGLSAREFFDRVVVAQFSARGMVEGPTFGFGRDRGGDAALLGSWCAEAGRDFRIAPPTEVDGRIVSSSRIRQALSGGDVAEAAALLGRPHRLRGTVVRGAGRGAGLGFPTANLAGPLTQVPADGVYAVRVRVVGASAWHRGAAHIGANATFDETARSVEVHLINFAGDLYGKALDIDLMGRIRGSKKFDGVQELLDQIRSDVEAASDAGF